MSIVWLGIDNGLSGGVAIIDGDRITLHDTPTVQTKTKRAYLEPQMAEILRPYAGRAYCMIEAVSGRPGEGAASARSIGLGHGLWLGMLAMAGISYEIVTPAVWKRAFSLLGQDKDVSRLRAQQLFPSVYEQLKLKKHDGRAESLLLAEYGRRKVAR